ncbi:ATP-binding cassette domain-containing protein [Bacillus capparidis]|uniref:ABC-2 type transport system ATP-binding protein n=1 Tax=Bacillus capparidis TaxID=1840411 RepID=A0ABS4D3P4_9BACI|nr:ATP-binding cassette domain-containing protein [Bacillus capparidis]MBP1084220.1 ABC-2 type transport system ATP-binding protein [Bacillus capparidis]MED1094664.1 ATP-binding cassette domain-containing protein [Bacillus capparidis]
MEVGIELTDIIIGGKKIINKTSFKITGENSYCITGVNGAGKTTLLKHIATSPEVKITLNNQHVKPLDFQKTISFIPNDPPLFEVLTGYENIEYIMALWKIKEKDCYLKRVHDYCNLLGLTKENLTQQIHTYSLGMRYKLFFIAMISRDIQLLLLDEPFTALDKNSQNEIYKILKEFTSKGNILIFVSHIEEFKQKLSNYVFEIKDKQLII